MPALRAQLGKLLREPPDPAAVAAWRRLTALRGDHPGAEYEDLRSVLEHKFPERTERLLLERFAVAHRNLELTADRLQMDTGELRAELEDRLREIAPHPTAIRVGQQSLSRILTAGRFRSVRETKGKNPIGLPVRDEVESTLYGRPVDADPREDIIYGYIALDTEWPAGQFSPGDEGSIDQLSQYGDVVVVLKRELDERTTFGVGDTFADPKAALPCPKTDVRWHAYGLFPEKPWHPLSIVRRRFDDPTFYARSYAEAQIHGGVTVRDIDYIVLPAEPLPRMRSFLADTGVAWETVNFESIARQDDPAARVYAVRRLERELEYISSTWPGQDQARGLKGSLTAALGLFGKIGASAVKDGTTLWAPEVAKQSPHAGDASVTDAAAAHSEVRRELVNLERRLLAKAVQLNTEQVSSVGKEAYETSVRTLLSPQIENLVSMVDKLASTQNFDAEAYQAWHIGGFKTHISLRRADGGLAELTFIDRGLGEDNEPLDPVLVPTESAEHKLVLIKLLAQWDRDPEAIVEVVTRRLHSGTAMQAGSRDEAISMGLLAKSDAERQTSPG